MMRGRPAAAAAGRTLGMPTIWDAEMGWRAAWAAMRMLMEIMEIMELRARAAATTPGATSVRTPTRAPVRLRRLPAPSSSPGCVPATAIGMIRERMNGAAPKDTVKEIAHGLDQSAAPRERDERKRRRIRMRLLRGGGVVGMTPNSFRCLGWPRGGVSLACTRNSADRGLPPASGMTTRAAARRGGEGAASPAAGALESQSTIGARAEAPVEGPLTGLPPRS